MFDITSSKLLLLGIVALIVIGPKDLPVLLRTIGKYVGIIKRQAADFRAQFDEAIRESELDQLKKDVESMGQEAEASMREAERSVTTELDAVKADVEAATDTALLDKPADPQAHDVLDAHAQDVADVHAHDMPDVHAHDANGMPIARSEVENALNGAEPHREETDAAGAPVDGSPRVEHKPGA
jgi:sec-independent protein translocase protein TatB